MLDAVLERLSDIKKELVRDVVLMLQLLQVEQFLMQLRLRYVIASEDAGQGTGDKSKGGNTSNHNDDAVDSFHSGGG